MRFFISFMVFFSLLSCSKQDSHQLVIGTIAGPESALIEVGKAVAKEEYGLDVRIVEFTDYSLPNEALEDGSLDVNAFQHGPYLQESQKAHGYHLEVIGKTFVYPMAIYSKKITTLADLPEKAVIALPNDPSNEARALYLLQKAGLVSFKDNQNPNLQDINVNLKQLQFKTLDAAQLPRILEDVDAAVINTTFALPAGLRLKSALFIEGKDSPYANLIVMKQGNIKKDKLLLLVNALNSVKVKQKAQDLFGDAAIPAW